MKFEWDAGKARRNLAKHGVSFAEARSIFFGPFAVTVDDERHSALEQREKTIGFSERLRVLVVIHTRETREVIRIISARKASREETQTYEEELKQRLEEKR